MKNCKDATLLQLQESLFNDMILWRIEKNKQHSCGVYGCGLGDINGNLYPMCNGDGICHLSW